MAIAEGGQYTLLSVHGPGDLVGECALFSSVSQTHGQTVTGITRGMAWRVPQGRFRQILRSHPQGWEVLSCHLHARATAAEERICLMANEPASQRLAVFLLQLLAKDGSTPTDGDQTQEVPLPLTQAQMAQFIGVSRETVERVLRKWVRDKTVQTNRLSIIVENVPQLQKIADGWRPFLLPIRSQTRSAPGVRRDSIQ